VKTKIIFSLKLAAQLIAQGFKVIDCMLNTADQTKIVFVFEYDKELDAEFKSIVNNYKQIKE
jgi:hypothetical protein